MSALRGAVGFLTRIPVNADKDDWVAFASTPAVFPLVGYLIGVLAALAFLLPPTVAPFGYLVALAALTGINHLDGLADLGDAAVVHGDAERRREVLKDSAIGVGGVGAVGLALIGTALAALFVTGIPLTTTVGIVIASEVGAKVGMATLACTGEASHEGFASAFTERCSPAMLHGPLVVATPALGFWILSGTPAVAALIAPLGVAVWLRRWATENLGGVNGDIFGAANELGRLAGLYGALLLV